MNVYLEVGCQICHHLVSAVRQFICKQIGQTQLKWKNNRRNNSTIAKLVTTGFELTTPAAKLAWSAKTKQLLQFFAQFH